MFLQIYLSTEGKETQRDKQQLPKYFNSSVKFERIDGNEAQIINFIFKQSSTSIQGTDYRYI